MFYLHSVTMLPLTITPNSSSHQFHLAITPRSAESSLLFLPLDRLPWTWQSCDQRTTGVNTSRDATSSPSSSRVCSATPHRACNVACDAPPETSCAGRFIAGHGLGSAVDVKTRLFGRPNAQSDFSSWTGNDEPPRFGTRVCIRGFFSGFILCNWFCEEAAEHPEHTEAAQEAIDDSFSVQFQSVTVVETLEKCIVARGGRKEFGVLETKWEFKHIEAPEEATCVRPCVSDFGKQRSFWLVAAETAIVIIWKQGRSGEVKFKFNGATSTRKGSGDEVNFSGE